MAGYSFLRLCTVIFAVQVDAQTVAVWTFINRSFLDIQLYTQ